MELTIEKLVYGGDGLSRLPEGEVLFVPYSVPGDRIQAERQAGQVKPPRATICDVLEPGPDRTQAPCSVFGLCGGCQWQHITPTAQRTWKRRIVEESLQRIGKLSDVNVLETLGSDETAWHYRSRVQWEVEPEGNELTTHAHLLGYYASQSHEVVEFSHCHIIPELLNQIAFRIRDFIRENPDIGSALLRIEALINDQDQVLVLLVGEKANKLDTLVQALTQAFPQIKGITHRDSARKNNPPTRLWGEPFLIETLGGQTYRVSAGSFFQTNRLAAAQLLKVLDEWMLPSAASLLDLYAGVGVFGIHFGNKIKRILAIESAKSALLDAEENLGLNNITSVELRAGDVRATLNRLQEKFEVAIVDPPRAGCQPEVLSWLSKNITRQLLYVSCNPTTLARDLKTLTSQGWKLQNVQPIDMFPQTYHVECVANLYR